MSHSSHVLVDRAIAQGIIGFLERLADRNDPGAETARSFARELRNAAPADAPAPDTLALATLAQDRIAALLRRGSTHDDGDFVITPTASELADDEQGIAEITALNALEHQLRTLITTGAGSPLADLVEAYRAQAETLSELHDHMEALGFYEADDEDIQINGGDTVDVLTAMRDTIRTHVAGDGRHMPVPPPSHTAGIRALADLVDQVRAIGIPDWAGAEGLDLTDAETLLQASGYTVSSTSVTAPTHDLETLEVHAEWVVSSDHIPSDLYEKLRADADTRGGDAYYGCVPASASLYSVTIEIPPADEDTGEPAPHESLSNLVMLARAHGFTRLRLDMDGPMLSRLPRVGHGVPETCLDGPSAAPQFGA